MKAGPTFPDSTVKLRGDLFYAGDKTVQRTNEKKGYHASGPMQLPPRQRRVSYAL
jgi:hypothetical protein